MKSTIYDVAKEAGVSIATVSKVINGKGKISVETRDVVLAIMDRLDYQPSVIASALTGDCQLRQYDPSNSDGSAAYDDRPTDGAHGETGCGFNCGGIERRGQHQTENGPAAGVAYTRIHYFPAMQLNQNYI